MEKIIQQARENYFYNHEEHHFNVNCYQKPFTYYDKSNNIKSYNVSLNVINQCKECYPCYNASYYNCNLTSMTNCFLLKIYITNTIVKYKMFTSGKDLTCYCNMIYNMVQKMVCYHLFLIPEQNFNFTGKQITRHITRNKGE